MPWVAPSPQHGGPSDQVPDAPGWGTRCCRAWRRFLDADCEQQPPEGSTTASLVRHFFDGRSLDRRAARKKRCSQGAPRPSAQFRQRGMLQATVSGKAIEDERDYWPVFVLSQSLLVFLLWVIFAAQSEEFFSAKAGLDSIVPGTTNMAIHSDCEDLRWQIWRWLTYQFTHAGLSHVGLNIFIVLVVGMRLEMYHGHVRTLVVFNLGVICAAFNFAVADGHASLIGMSGGAYALMGMTFGSLILNWHDTRYRRPELLVLLVLFALDLVFAYADGLAKDSEVSHSAHFGGYAAGFVLGILVGRNLDEEEKQEHAKTLRCERILQLVLGVVGAIVLVSVIAWAAQWPPRTLSDTTPWCWNRQIFNQSLFPEFRFHCIRCQDDSCVSRFEAMANVEQVSFRVCEGVGWSYSQ
ncbi:unnamed protein product [Effrenium voratum]|nr:unnamed protein product [Effrenium voratum]